MNHQNLKTAYLVASGDLRHSANEMCWPAQEEMESQICAAFAQLGMDVVRAHPYNPNEKHGFISSQRMGMDIFQNIPDESPVIVAEAVWQYSYHVLAGLRDHHGPILTIANWSGQWSGLVGMLNINGCLAKMGVKYSTIWSETFDDAFFIEGIKNWIATGEIIHDCSHTREFSSEMLTDSELEVGTNLAKQLRKKKAIMGIFDEGCMGMYNAIVEDELLNACGIYKERLSQSALLAEMKKVNPNEAQAVKEWLEVRGMQFKLGKDPATELTENQVLEQLKMYIAVVRISNAFQCDTIGIQYQQGLKDMAPASDLAEGLLNNPERPPVYHAVSGEELYTGLAIPHFNEVDECAGIDALVTNRVWKELGFDPSTTLHDIRWGRHYRGDGIDDFVWVFEISGAAPASHFINGYAGAISERQPPMYFPLGGGTLKGISKPGEIVWSRVYVMDARLHADIGRGKAVRLPDHEVHDRWQSTTEQWPMMNAVLYAVSRDQLMARHKANHIQVGYAPDAASADKVLAIKAAMFNEMGIHVHFCGECRTK